MSHSSQLVSKSPEQLHTAIQNGSTLSQHICIQPGEKKDETSENYFFFPFIQQTFSRISITNKTSVRSIPVRILSFQFCVPKNVGLAKQAGLERDSQDCRHNQVWNYMIRESYPWR